MTDDLFVRGAAICELRHSASYCGIPAAAEGFRHAAEVLDELGAG